LLVGENDRLICQLVFGDDVPDCMREIVATATRGHHERDRLLRLSGASTVPFKVSAATRGSNLVLAGIFPPAFFFQAVLTPESDNRLTRLR
jgi:hypothetical protein